MKAFSQMAIWIKHLVAKCENIVAIGDKNSYWYFSSPD
jgi:hypothetical protein